MDEAVHQDRVCVCAAQQPLYMFRKGHEQCCTQDRPDPEGSAAETPSISGHHASSSGHHASSSGHNASSSGHHASSSGHHASGSGSHASSSNDYTFGNQTAANSASSRAQLPAGHAAAMREFREHADNTNDIFLVAAQAIAHSLITAHTALASGKCTACLLPLVLSLWSLLISDDSLRLSMRCNQLHLAIFCQPKHAHTLLQTCKRMPGIFVATQRKMTGINLCLCGSCLG